MITEGAEVETVSAWIGGRGRSTRPVLTLFVFAVGDRRLAFALGAAPLESVVVAAHG
jgi:hypothetical protein